MKPFLCIAAAALFPATAVDAQEPDKAQIPHWYVRLGPGRAIFHADAKVAIAGVPVPGSPAKIDNNWGFAIEGGYYFNPHVSVAITAGIPPTTTLSSSGALASAGRLARIGYGPGVIAVSFHPLSSGPIKPYVGSGIGYTVIVHSENIVLQNTHVANAVGPVVVGGVEIPISRRVALFADAKQIWATTNARFDLPTPIGLLPGAAKLRLDPSLIQMGVTYRF